MNHIEQKMGKCTLWVALGSCVSIMQDVFMLSSYIQFILIQKNVGCIARK